MSSPSWSQSKIIIIISSRGKLYNSHSPAAALLWYDQHEPFPRRHDMEGTASSFKWHVAIAKEWSGHLMDLQLEWRVVPGRPLDGNIFHKNGFIVFQNAVLLKNKSRVSVAIVSLLLSVHPVPSEKRGEEGLSPLLLLLFSAPLRNMRMKPVRYPFQKWHWSTRVGKVMQLRNFNYPVLMVWPRTKDGLAPTCRWNFICNLQIGA